jgi:hypothetical protein
VGVSEETGPLLVPPPPLVEDTDTKSLRVPVVNPPLPEPVTAPRVDDSELVIPKRPNIFRRHLPMPPVPRRRVSSE